MKALTQKNVKNIELGGRKIKYQVVISKTARHLRLRVGVKGIEVIQPIARPEEEMVLFLRANEQWLISQLKRVERLRTVRQPPRKKEREIFYRGERTPVRVQDVTHWQGANQVTFENGCIVIVKGSAAQTLPQKSLENWLRKQARLEIERQLEVVTHKLKRFPNKVYIKGQRTKWGNCSARQNLSFNWRLIMSPDFVLRYLVTHEATHLAIPDHSKKFWLTVQSLCPDSERARQWLAVNGQKLLLGSDLGDSLD